MIHACTLIIVHARTMIRVHACTIIIHMYQVLQGPSGKQVTQLKAEGAGKAQHLKLKL